MSRTAFPTIPVGRGMAQISPAGRRIAAAVSPRGQAVPSQEDLDVTESRRDELPAGGAFTVRSWAARQNEMCLWYDRLFEGKEEAIATLHGHYDPFTALLSSFSGRVLDIGGGNAFARRFISPDSEYICLDPSAAWLRPEWAALPEHCLRTGFVLGVGEFLPFRANTFDGALAMWSLNHVCEPEAVFKEVNRVLKCGARWLAVFEDVEPTWLDAIAATALNCIGMKTRLVQLEAPGRKIIKRKLIKRLRGQEWPLQSDHLRIRDSDLSRWCRGRFRRTKRRWVSGFLVYELVKLSTQGAEHG